MHEYENFKTMCAARVSRSEQVLNRWVNDPKVDLDLSAKEWLICALDPFHDKEIPNLRGWPDVSTAGSVVQTVKLQMQISATSGGGSEPAGNWDCHVAAVPVLSKGTYAQSSLRRNNFVQYNNASYQTANFGGLMARSSAPNQPVNWFPPLEDPSLLGDLALGPEFEDGLTRVIGMGFEIYDTTAKINQQGSLVSYRQSEPEKEASLWNAFQTDSDAGQMVISSFTGTPLRAPPRTANEAHFMGSKIKTTNAFKGTYEVAAFHSNQNPPQPPSYIQPVFMHADTQDSIGGINSTTMFWPSPQPNYDINWNAYKPPPDDSEVGAIVSVAMNYYEPIKIHPFHQFGCIIQGLHPKATLTIEWIVYVERFANCADKQLAVMCRESAGYSSRALEIYSHCVADMPVGVPVNENGLGQWFSDVIADIEPMISPILSAVHPLAGMASKAVGSMNNAYRAQNGQGAPGPGANLGAKALQPKRKKAKKKNSALAAGSRGKKGNIQGPMRS